MTDCRKQQFTINLNGRLYDFREPKVMGIINVTPDSFYSGSRTEDRDSLQVRVERMLADGVDIFDVGGYSSRPGCSDVTADEEYSRLSRGLEVIRSVASGVPVSVDTFRADVGRRCIGEWGVEIINDVGGGDLDPEMFGMVASEGVAYVLMHIRGNLQTMARMTDYSDVTAEVISQLAFKLDRLHDLGVADVIVDPGFGFAKTPDQNFTLLRELDEFRVLDCPILAGLSRKSMIWKSLGITPAESLNGTTALNMASLLAGADILRVHDVREARECVDLYKKLIGK